MKRILALILAGLMIFSFAACGGSKSSEETTLGENELNPDNFFDEDVTDAPAADATTAAPAADATTAAPAADATTAAPAADATTAAPAADATTAAPAADATTAAPTTKAPSAGLTSTDKAEVLAYYNAALAKSKNTKCTQTMRLVDGSLGGDGAVGAILKVLEPAAKNALAKNSHERDNLPGQPDKYPLTVADVKSAKAVSSNGVTKIRIDLNQQVDGPNGDGDNGGPVARGVGTLGSIDNALSEMGATLTDGRDTVKLTYNDAYIMVEINESTGKITKGTWHQMTNIFIGNAKAKLGISATLKNFKGQVEFKVVI